MQWLRKRQEQKGVSMRRVLIESVVTFLMAAGAVACGGSTRSTPTSPTSSPVTTTAPPAPVVPACSLAAPTGLRTSSLTSGGTLLLFVSWDAVPGATAYVYEMGTSSGATTFTRDVTLNPSGDGGGSILVGAGTNAFTFTRGSSYFIRARAKNATCTGPASAELQRDYT
jgi:hypothetical protein